MSKYTSADCRLCRREGSKLFLKGDRCFSGKCAVVRRPSAPGQHGTSRKKVSEYGLQLREKQKTKRIYGLGETQFRNTFKKAEIMKGAKGENLLQLLERRFDNVIFKLGLAKSRSLARQLINHGHFNIDGKSVNIPSYTTKAGQVISVKQNKKDNNYFKALLSSAKLNLPKWLEFNFEKLEGRIIALPSKEDLDIQIADNMI
ncbi:MAG: 30S ribosomal protein S4, partial [Firmicutes bacterium]|nr:30S ribosomal protein S4 [Bacillota bacterium]